MTLPRIDRSIVDEVVIIELSTFSERVGNQVSSDGETAALRLTDLIGQLGRAGAAVILVGADQTLGEELVECVQGIGVDCLFAPTDAPLPRLLGPPTLSATIIASSSPDEPEDPGRWLFAPV